MKPMTELPNTTTNTDCKVCKMTGHNANISCTMNQDVSTNVYVQESNVNTPTPAPTPAPAPKHRKNVDFNICELVDAILISVHANNKVEYPIMQLES